MDYTGTGGAAAVGLGGTLAYTGANDMTPLWLVLGLLLIVAGVTFMAVASRRNRRDARAAGVDSSTPPNDNLT